VRDDGAARVPWHRQIELHAMSVNRGRGRLGASGDQKRLSANAHSLAHHIHTYGCMLDRRI
jgi:hypothetical protein